MKRKLIVLSAGVILFSLCASAQTFSPTSITNLVLWLKADTAIFNAEGQPPTEGGTVARWEDQSGQGHHVVQVNDAIRPLYTGNGQNGIAAIYNPSTAVGAGNNYSGQGLRYMEFEDTANPVQTRSIFVVGKPPASAANKNPNVIIGRYQGGTAGNVELFVRNGDANNDCISFDGTITSSRPTGRYALNGGTLSASGYSFNPPGYIIPSPFLGYFEYDVAQACTLFLRRDTTGNKFSYRGEFSEILVYSHPLTEEEQQQVGYYLQTKYQINGSYVAPGEAYVEVLAATEVADTYAQVSGEVKGLTSGSAVLKVYYGPADCGKTETGWQSSMLVNDSVTELGIYSVMLNTGLAANTTYYYRFALETAPGAAAFSDVMTFTTHPRIITRGVDRVTETAARLAAEVIQMLEGDQATLRVYYGLTDGGTSPGAWNANDTVSTAIAANGTYYYDTAQALTLGQTYYYRFSLQVDGGVETFANAGGTFTTIPYDTPASFIWNGDSYGTNNWAEPIWINLSTGIRAYPSILGDEAAFTAVPSNRFHNIQIQLTNSLIHLKALTTGHLSPGNGDPWYSGGEFSFINGGTDPVEIVLDSTQAGKSAVLTSRGTQSITWGQSTNDNITLRLNSPLDITRGSSYTCHIRLNAKITGGTLGQPSRILATFATDWTSHYVYLLNPENDFIGDIYCNRANTGNAVGVLSAGRSEGAHTNTANNAVFGHPSNQIILRTNTRLLLYGSANDGAFTFERTVRGQGSIDRTVSALGTSYTVNKHLDLDLGANSVLAPGEGNTNATLNVLANTITSDPASTLRFKLNTNSICDKVFLNARGSVTLNGKLELVPQAKSQAGDRWPILSATNLVTSLNVNFASKTPGYSIIRTQDANGNWLLEALRAPLTIFLQ